MSTTTLAAASTEMTVDSNSRRPTSIWTVLAVALSLVALAGSLWLSLGMNLRPCPLCYYQRTFVMGVVGVLAVGLLTTAGRAGPLSLLALPAAAGGLAVAVWHVYLEAAGKLECPAGIEGIGSAPQQSLVILALLTIVLLLDILRPGRIGVRAMRAMTGAVLVGGGLAYGAIKTAAPSEQPTTPYTKPLDICRPPYRGTS